MKVKSDVPYKTVSNLYENSYMQNFKILNLNHMTRTPTNGSAYNGQTVQRSKLCILNLFIIKVGLNSPVVD